jgi:hypothetical protein
VICATVAALFAGCPFMRNSLFFNQAFSAFPQVNGMLDDMNFDENLRGVPDLYLKTGSPTGFRVNPDSLLSVRIYGQTCCLPVVFAIRALAHRRTRRLPSMHVPYTRSQ